MRKSFLKKAIVTFALAATCMIGGLLGTGHKVSAATNNNYKCISIYDTSKVGNYYFVQGENKTLVKKSAKGKTYLSLKNVNCQIVTNGKYAFYVNEKNNSLYRTTLSNKKTIRLAKIKGDDYWVNYVYGGSVYLNNGNVDDSCTIKVFNMGKKTMKTVAKRACVYPISGSGSHLVYKSYTNDNVYLRNCYTGKTTTLKALKYSSEFKICGNKIAFVNYDETKDSYVVNTYNISTNKVTVVKAIGDDLEAGVGDFNDNLTTYTYGDHVLNMKTGELK